MKGMAYVGIFLFFTVILLFSSAVFAGHNYNECYTAKKISSGVWNKEYLLHKADYDWFRLFVNKDSCDDVQLELANTYSANGKDYDVSVHRCTSTLTNPPTAIITCNNVGNEACTYSAKGEGGNYYFKVFGKNPDKDFDSSYPFKLRATVIPKSCTCQSSSDCPSGLTCERNVCVKKDVCGDGICGSSESATSCSADCGVTPPQQPVCGNGKCESGETSDNCISDCPKPPSQSVCGNGKREPPFEECDGNDFGLFTCASLGAGIGQLSCNSQCKVDTSSCEDPCKNKKLDFGEEGVDCGGSCKPCPECVPLTPTNSEPGKINVVFIRDFDYNNDMDTFRKDAKEVIESAYKVKGIISNNIDKFNFYYLKTGEVNSKYDGKCSLGLRDRPLLEFITKSVYSKCVFPSKSTVIRGILHRKDVQDCALGDIFTSNFDEYGTIIHESGHAIFGLADEYCCGSFYNTSNPFPNIWPSKEDCERDISAYGYIENMCDQFCDKTWEVKCVSADLSSRLFGSDWWRLTGRSISIMNEDGGKDSSNVFNSAHIKRINYVFDNLAK